MHLVRFIFILFIFFNFNLFAQTQTIPENLVSLSSPLGIKLFKQSFEGEYFLPLELQFVTQDSLTYCSIASSVMVLNALSVTAPIDPKYPAYKFFTQSNLFTPAVNKVISEDLVKKQGLTLDQMSTMLSQFDVDVKKFHSDTITFKEFRKLASETVTQKKGYIIINFLRMALGETGGGHMSPLAAYDKLTDRFLILDVARYRYPSVWVTTQDLWSAINTIDNVDNKYRGFVIVSKK